MAGFHVEQVGGGRPHYRIVFDFPEGARAFLLHKPPSPDPKDKRLAIPVAASGEPFEESPAAILWDRGACTPVQHQYGPGRFTATVSL